MEGLAEHISTQLADEEIEVTPEQIQACIDSFSPEEKAPVKKAVPKKGKSAPVPKSKTASKKTAKKADSVDEEAHTCGYTVNGKEGAYICKKNASNEVNGVWYCGTENTGHYKSSLAKASAAKGKKSAPAKTSSKASTKTAPKGKAGKSIPSVIAKVKKESVQLSEVPKKGSGIWVDLKHHRMVYSKEPQETYGILDEDDETILPLTDDAASFAEANNIPIRAAKKTPKSKVVASKGKVAAPKAKVVAKSKPKSVVSPKSRAKAVIAAPKSKASSKAKKVAPTEEDDEIEEELRQNVEDVVDGEEEPEVEEEPEDVIDVNPDGGDDGEEIDLGEDIQEEEEKQDDEEEVDVEEVDEGEAVDEGEVEEPSEDEE